MPDETKVVIPLNRYEILLDLETRVNVAVERIKHEEYIKTEDILWILGTDMAMELAQELMDERERRDKEFREKYDFSKPTDNEPSDIEVVGVDELIEEICGENDTQ